MKEYGINFNVSSPKAEHLVVTTITIGERSMTKEESISVDLVNHPLYPQLEQYVLANPAKKKAPISGADRVQ